MVRRPASVRSSCHQCSTSRPKTRATIKSMTVIRPLLVQAEIRRASWPGSWAARRQWLVHLSAVSFEEFLEGFDLGLQLRDLRLGQRHLLRRWRRLLGPAAASARESPGTCPTPAGTAPGTHGHVFGHIGNRLALGCVALNVIDELLDAPVGQFAIRRTQLLDPRLEIGSATPAEQRAVVDEIGVLVQRCELGLQRGLRDRHRRLHVGIHLRRGSLGQRVQHGDSPLPVAAHPHPLVLPLVVDQPHLVLDRVGADLAQQGNFRVISAEPSRHPLVSSSRLEFTVAAGIGPRATGRSTRLSSIPGTVPWSDDAIDAVAGQ